MFLLIIDAHSKWLEIHMHVTATSTAAVTFHKLLQTFATFGLPETLVSDNSAAFTSLELQEFMMYVEWHQTPKDGTVSSCIKWSLSLPDHP